VDKIQQPYAWHTEKQSSFHIPVFLCYGSLFLFKVVHMLQRLESGVEAHNCRAAAAAEKYPEMLTAEVIVLHFL